MIRFSQIAAPAAVAAALLIGGCASHERPDEIPPTASVLTEGDEVLATSAPHDGTVYIWDKTADKMVYTGKVERGDMVRVDAKNNKVYFNDKLSSERDLIDDHNYRIFFERSDKEDADIARHRQAPAGATVIQPRSDGTTVIQPPAGQTTVVQPAPQPNTTVVQPPADSSGTTVVRPDGTIERHSK